MYWWWWIAPALVAVLGFVFVIGGLRWLLRGRGLKGGRGIVGGAIVAGAATLVGLIGLNVQTYERLSYERPVATIELSQSSPGVFQAILVEPPSPDRAEALTREFEVRGDEWRLEARVLKWKPWANVLGLDAQYRLDRFSGRYSETQDELHAERSVYGIRPVVTYGVDVWPMVEQANLYAPLVDTLYGSGAFMPMVDGASYEVRITQGGLVARPTNEIAASASANGWQ